ncbi:MAG: hypothetical protein SangKO_075860 [Sandaracinaceae bacterium]
MTPEFASTEIPFAQTVWIGARGVTNGFLGPNNSVGGIRFRGPSGFVDRVCTWSAGQTLTITVDHAAGTLTVAGATTGKRHVDRHRDRRVDGADLAGRRAERGHW